MEAGLLFACLLGLPVAAAAVCLVLPSARAILLWLCAAAAGVAAIAFFAAARVFQHGPVSTAGGWLYLDGLSAYHLGLLQVIFLLSTFYTRGYFAPEIAAGTFGTSTARRFGALWMGALGAMVLVLASNNLGIAWVGIEASTLLTAFLICTHRTAASLEAMWKYLIMCSVGVALAFIGILLTAASAGPQRAASSDTLLWTNLLQMAPTLNAGLLKMGFVFLLVGYGTKVGLAPMHNWLPDAHSQAPAPVSSVFSGFLLNSALYCILRYVPIVEAGPGNAMFARDLLVVLGLASILVAGAFILFQHDIKRLLAYHSVEHLGIIALGVGLGGLGTFAAMFHTLNHSLCKSLGFLSSGRLGQMYGTHDLRQMAGAARTAPVWGKGLLASLLVLIGLAPFAIFLSELLILKAAVDRRAYVVAGLFLLGMGIVFVSALRHAISVAWDQPVCQAPPERATWGDKAMIVLPLAALLVLGLWMPQPLQNMLSQAAAVIQAVGK